MTARIHWTLSGLLSIGLLLEADLAGRLEHQNALSTDQRAARSQAWEEWLGSAPVRTGQREEVFPPEGSTSTGG